MTPPDSLPTFGAFFFGALDAQRSDLYGGVIAAAKLADQLGLAFVSTPERHFHRFGGAFPHPAVLGAAIAAVTERIRIRAGSVVAPLHNPIRLVEEFAVVDQLSGGRVDLSIGSGWNVNDFAIDPTSYENRRTLVYQRAEEIAPIWATGETCASLPGGEKRVLPVFPRPVQPRIPIWLTISRNVDTFRKAGELGYNVLTHVENQTLSDLTDNIAVYRDAHAAAGHRGRGTVTVMTHTSIDRDRTLAIDRGRGWLRDYLSTAIDLEASAVGSGGSMSGGKVGSPLLGEARARNRLADLAAQRYLDGLSLIGTPQDCADVARSLGRAGVDEIACLLDFVPDDNAILRSIRLLAEITHDAEQR